MIGGHLAQLTYSTRQALGKAVEKTKKGLPSAPFSIGVFWSRPGLGLEYGALGLPDSPRKRKAVIHFLTSEEGLIPKAKVSRLSGLPEETAELVKAFYARDDISRMIPGQRDHKILKIDGKKISLQKRKLYYTVSETYELFKGRIKKLK